MFPKTHIKDQHNTKLDIRHAKALGDRQEDWCENKDCRCNVHKHTNYHQNNIHQKKDHIFIR